MLLSPLKLLYREDLKNVQYMHPTFLLPSVLNQHRWGLQCSCWKLLTTWLAVTVLLFIYLIVYIRSQKPNWINMSHGWAGGRHNTQSIWDESNAKTFKGKSTEAVGDDTIMSPQQRVRLAFIGEFSHLFCSVRGYFGTVWIYLFLISSWHPLLGCLNFTLTLYIKLKLNTKHERLLPWPTYWKL